MKPLILMLSLFAIASCKDSKPLKKEALFAKEMVLLVNYELDSISLEDHALLGAAVAPNFVADSIPGLLGKSFISNVTSGTFGGVYYFSSEAAVTSYLSSDLWKGIVAHPNLVNFKTDIFQTFEGSALAGGEHATRKTSSNPEDATELHVLVVHFKSEDSASTISTSIKESAASFNNEKFPGLIGKTFISKEKDSTFGGVYYFENAAAIDAYLATDFWKGFENSSGIEVFKKDRYGVASISAISNGIPVQD